MSFVYFYLHYLEMQLLNGVIEDPGFVPRKYDKL